MTTMKKNIMIAGIIIFVVGLLLLLLNGHISSLVFQEAITEMEPQSIMEIIGSLLTASTIAGSAYRLIGVIALFLIIIGLVMAAVGFLFKDKKIKSFKKRNKIFPTNNKAKYTRSITNKKSKIASLIVTGWGRKNKRAKRVKLKQTKKSVNIKNKKYQAWGKNI